MIHVYHESKEIEIPVLWSELLPLISIKAHLYNDLDLGDDDDLELNYVLHSNKGLAYQFGNNIIQDGNEVKIGFLLLWLKQYHYWLRNNSFNTISDTRNVPPSLSCLVTGYPDHTRPIRLLLSYWWVLIMAGGKMKAEHAWRY